MAPGPALPEAPTGLRAATLSATGLRLTWDRPDPLDARRVIGYVLHIRRLGGKSRAGSEPGRTLLSSRF